MIQQEQQDLHYFYPVRPNNERQQTDSCCKIVYSILTLSVLIPFFYSYILEKQQNLFIPRDPSGNRCGIGSAEKYPYIYFPSPFPESIDKSVCVSECPTSMAQREIQCLPNTLVQSCNFDITDHFNRSNQFIVYPTSLNPILSLCQPEQRILQDVINSKINTQELLINFQQIYQAKNVIIFLCPGVCIGLMALYLILILVCQNMKPLFIGIIVCFLCTIAYLSAYFFLPKTITSLPYSRAVGALLALVFIILLVYLILQRKYVRRSLQLIDIGTDYVRDNKRLVLMPLGMLFLWGLFFSIELTLIIFIYSIDSTEQNNQSEQQFPYVLSLDHSIFVKILLAITIIHYIWTNIIIQHMGKYVSRVGTAFWIMHIPNHFKNALYSMFTFHLGSILKGSFFITLFWWVTDFFYFIMPDSNDTLCCCRLTSLANFYRTQFFSKHLGCYTQLNYIKIGLDGQGFHESAHKFTPLLVQNIQFVNQAYKMAKRIMDISQILVAILTTVICFIVLEISTEFSSHVITLIIIFIISLLLSSFGFDAYDRAFQTILLTIILNMNFKRSTVQRIGVSAVIDFEKSGKEEKRRIRMYKEIERWIIAEREKHEQKNDQVEVEKIN